MRPGQSLPKLTARLLVKLEASFQQRRPDLILGHGDTTTCFAAALSSFYQHIPFFHVEAGLRSHHLTSPFPEEFNRQSVAPMARHHFAPTELEKENLIRDGILPGAITVTGSTIHDAIHLIQTKKISNTFLQNQKERPTVVVTLHRRESNQTMVQTLTGVKQAAQKRPDVMFICPMHPNPTVQNTFRRLLQNQQNIFLIDPLPYPEFISLLRCSQLVVTDSGGVQEEAAHFGKNVLLARLETERQDGVGSGRTRLIGTNADIAAKVIGEFLGPHMFYSAASPHPLPQAISASSIIAEVVARNVE